MSNRSLLHAVAAFPAFVAAGPKEFLAALPKKAGPALSKVGEIEMAEGGPAGAMEDAEGARRWAIRS